MGRKRIIAFTFDMIVITLFNILVSLFIVDKFFPALMGEITTSLLLAITLFCKDCYNGTSWGKYIMRIQIVDKQTMQPASPIKCTIRNLLYPIWFVEIIIFLCNKERKRLGDYITDTEVVDGINKRKNINWLQIIFSVLFIVLLFFAVFLVTYQSNPLYRLLMK